MKRLIYILVFFVGMVGSAAGQKVYEYGKSADGSYTVVETNSGLTQLYTDALNTKAEEVKDSIMSLENVPLRVLGCDFYSLVAYDAVGFDSLFNGAFRTINNDNDNFVFITKENGRDGLINYRSKIIITKPTTGGLNGQSDNKDNSKSAAQKLSDLDAEGIDVVSYRVLSVIEAQAEKDNNSFDKSALAEAAGLDELLKIIEELKSGLFDPKAFQAERILKELIDNHAIIDFVVTEETVIDPPPPVGLKNDLNKSNDESDPYYGFEFQFPGLETNIYTLGGLCKDIEIQTRYNYLYRFNKEPSIKSILYVYDQDYLIFKEKYDEYVAANDSVITILYVVLPNGNNSILCTLAKTNGELIKGIAREQIRFQENNSTTLNYSEDLRSSAALVLNSKGLEALSSFEEFGEFQNELKDLKVKSVNSEGFPIAPLIDSSLEGNSDDQFFSKDIPTYQFLRSRIRSLVNSLNGTVFMPGEPTLRKDAPLERMQSLVYSILCAKADLKRVDKLDYYWSGAFNSAREMVEGREFFNGLGIFDNVKFASANLFTKSDFGIPVEGVYHLDLNEPISKGAFNRTRSLAIGLLGSVSINATTYTIAFNFNNGEVQLPFFFNDENKRDAFFSVLEGVFVASQFNLEYFQKRSDVIANYIGGRENINRIGGLKVLGSILYTAPSCTYEMFSNTFRMAMLNFFLKEANMNDIQDESVVARLFGNIDIDEQQDNGKTRYEEFISQNFDNELLENLGINLDNDIRRIQFLKLVTGTHTRYLTKLNERNALSEAIRGSDLKGAYNLNQEYPECGSPISDERYSVSYSNAIETPYNLDHNYRGIDSYYPTVDMATGEDIQLPRYKNYQDPEGSFHPYDNVFLATNIFSIDVEGPNGIVQSNMGVVPFIAMGFILQNQKSDQNWNDFFRTVEVGLFFVGVGELSAAFRAFRVLKTASSYAQAARVSAGLMEVNAGIFSLACGGDSDAEICQWYRCRARPWIDASALASGGFYLTARSALTRLDAFNTVRAIDGLGESSAIYRFIRDAKNVDDEILEVLSKFYKTFDDVDLNKIIKLNEDLAKLRTNGNDITLLNACVDNPRLFRALDDMIQAEVQFARLNTDVLETYVKLNSKIRPLLLRFSDNADPTNSTIQKFVNDLQDPEFLSFINQSKNFDIFRGFVSHKGVDLSDISLERASSIFESIDDLEAIPGDLVRKWLNRSVGIATNQSKFAKAARFEFENSKKIIANTNPPCNAWSGNKLDDYFFQQMHVRAVGSEKRIILDDGILDAVEYFDEDLLVNYKRIRYHDSKLTNGSPWTDNQIDDIIQVFRDNPNRRYIEVEVRSGVDYFIKFPGSGIETNSKLRIYREDVFKSFSNGDGVGIIETVKMDDIGFKY